MELPAIPNRIETITAFKQNSGMIAAVLPIHYPRSLFRAFDVLPVEVWGPPGTDVSHGGAHLQPYVCSIVHNALSFLKKGGLDLADFIAVPHTCDSLQGFGSILLDFVKPKQSIFPLYLPRGNRPEDLRFLTEEFRQLYRHLSGLTGKKPSEEILLRCIRREEKADDLLRQLYEKRQKVSLSNYSFYHLVRTREYLPAETFISIAEKVLSRKGFDNPKGTAIILSGIVPEPMEVLTTITELGAAVVADDLACCGRRLYASGKSEQPFRRMAERILNAPPDPTRGNSLEERKQYLLRLADQTDARGVVFYDVKFCEPELFDLPRLRAKLKAAGLPSVQIEIDLNDPLSNQIVTRIGAFLEILG